MPTPAVSPEKGRLPVFLFAEREAFLRSGRFAAAGAKRENHHKRQQHGKNTFCFSHCLLLLVELHPAWAQAGPLIHWPCIPESHCTITPVELHPAWAQAGPLIHWPCIPESHCTITPVTGAIRSSALTFLKFYHDTDRLARRKPWRRLGIPHEKALTPTVASTGEPVPFYSCLICYSFVPCFRSQ